MIVQIISVDLGQRIVAVFNEDGRSIVYDILFWALRDTGAITGVILLEGRLIHCDVQHGFVRYFKG